jgi:NADH-quinone oxidoreductase subunit L
VPPLSGFFSKEAILGGVWERHPGVPFAMLALTAFLTAFYMFRVIFLAFFGRGHAAGHPHDPPALMSVPLWILLVLTVATGVQLLIAPAGDHHGPGWLMPLSIALALGGIGLAWLTYQRGAVDPGRLSAVLGPLDVMARHRYGFDALAEGLYRAGLLGFSRLIGWVDRYLVDGVLNVLSAWCLRAGDGLRRMQTGRAQDYVYGVAFGVLLVVAWVQWWGW